MINEVSSSPLHPSNFLPEWEQSNEGEPEQKDSRDSLMKSTQKTPSGKRKRKDVTQKEEVDKLIESV